MRLSVGRLKDDAAAGKLWLDAMASIPMRFTFAVGQILIGCSSIKSIAPFGIRVERAWNASPMSWDPRKEMWVPTVAAPKFAHYIRDDPVFRVCVLDIRRESIKDVVTFKAACAELSAESRVVAGRQEPLEFEMADLLGIFFVGDESRVTS